MSELRLILLITGVFGVASLYIWETLKRRRPRQSRNRPDRGVEAPDIGPSPGQPAPVDYLQTLTELSELTGADREAGTGTGFERQDAAGPVQASTGGQQSNGRETPEEDVIILHVRAAPGRTFSGGDIVRAAGKAGMRHGTMNIFHCYGDQSDQASAILFSLSNMFEPGTLAPDQMRSFQTTGVTLFMQLLPSRDNARIFERMLDAARQLAGELHGQICGSGRHTMSDALLSDLRDKAAAPR